VQRAPDASVPRLAVQAVGLAEGVRVRCADGAEPLVGAVDAGQQLLDLVAGACRLGGGRRHGQILPRVP
jgi:hypothetical protein